MTLAKAFVTGIVTRSPEKRFTQNDMPIVDFTINIDKNNETLLRVVAFGQLADIIATNVQLNDNVAVEGKSQVNSYKLPNGKDKKVYEINASNVEKMGIAGAHQTAIPANSNENIVSFEADEPAQDLIDEEEIPF